MCTDLYIESSTYGIVYVGPSVRAVRRVKLVQDKFRKLGDKFIMYADLLLKNLWF